MSDMTLGEAMEAIAAGSWACACAGPGPWPNCGCGRFWAEVRALHRAAHIVLKLVLQAAGDDGSADLQETYFGSGIYE